MICQVVYSTLSDHVNVTEAQVVIRRHNLPFCAWGRKDGKTHVSSRNCVDFLYWNIDPLLVLLDLCCEILCDRVSHITFCTEAWEIRKDCCFWKQKNAVNFFILFKRANTFLNVPVKCYCTNIFTSNPLAR